MDNLHNESTSNHRPKNMLKNILNNYTFKMD